MGCDIHLYVEKREGPSAPWVTADTWEPDEWEDEDGQTFSCMCVPYYSRFYNGRNYDLFAILADVRNGRGFAGIDTGDGFEPICDPRGLPEDACDLVKADSKRWGEDGHSHSWLTVAELLAYDWTKATKCRGVVNGPEFAEWDRWGRKRGEMPESYSGGVSGAGIEHVTIEEMDRRVATIREEFKDAPRGQFEKAVQERLHRVYCPFEQKQFYYDCAARFWSHCIPRLLAIKGENGEWLGPENVRIVFWFDN